MRHLHGSYCALSLVLVAGIVSGCAAPKPNRTARLDVPKVTPPSRLCKEPRLGQNGLCMPSDRMERLLRDGALSIEDVQRTDKGVAGASVWVLDFPDKKVTVRVKWKESKVGGDGLNNNPRKEIAAYKVQQLFLDSPDYVVPPTVGRCIRREYYAFVVRESEPTFKGGDCVFGVLSYWIEQVREAGKIDKEKMAREPIYRDSVANVNLLAYLIDHHDVRDANFLMSKDPKRPRVFSVDNGLAFSGLRNPLAALKRGDWSELLLDAYPKRSIDRLRQITRADLDELRIVAQYQKKDGQISEVAVTEPLLEGKGVVDQDATIQLGLTSGEIDGIEKRLQKLLEKIDKGKLSVY